jgi:hypothetical protein
MLLAELHTLSFAPLQSRIFRVLIVVTAFLALWIMSYPSEYQTYKPWTRQLTDIGWAIFPRGSDTARFWAGIGGQLLCFSVYFSPDMRQLFSLPLLTWLGAISSSMYFLHGTLMRSLLAWMTFGVQAYAGVELVDGMIPMCATWALLFILPSFWLVLLAVSTLWMYKVMPYFDKAVDMLQEIACGGKNRWDRH